MSITVLRPGMLSSVQDRGRFGFQHLGVPVCGAMDAFSHRVANILAGNPEDAATLEVTLRGPRLRFDAEALVALCGARLSPRIGGEPVPEGRPVRVRAGAVLEFGEPVAGCRAYLAVHGGIAVPPVMGSRSTYDIAHMGGLGGRALRAGDVLPAGKAGEMPCPGLAREPGLRTHGFAAPKWAVNQHAGQLGRDPQRLRILAGRHWDAFPAASREAFTGSDFRVAADSNRMGCRLEGPDIGMRPALEILSEAVTFGTIQVPPSGRPIVLMADRQTLGGYPRIAEVAGVDLHLAAQLRPGDRLRFEQVSLAQAQALWLKREQEIIAIREAVEQHLGE
ncbi:MAG TPA: biotin-dependent carboxyltransferase family protein [Burkholderiales bacterium]|nr:biotin-dependent carboxyltransferase family protein [Burkholderiales bacterium]